MYELLVERSSATAIRHVVTFARRLAEATRGALLDQQTDQIWTRGKLRTPPRTHPGAVSVVEVRWYVRSDFGATEAAATWARLARRYLAEAIPRRYGTYEPLSRKFDDGRDEALIEFVGDADGIVFFKGSHPVDGGHIDAGPQRGNAGAHTLTMLQPALDDSRWRAALRGLFLGFADAVDAIVATAEVVRGLRWSGRSLGYDGDTERTAYLAWKKTWQGLPPYPVWWTWFGKDYAEVVSRHLPSDQTEPIGSGLFHWRSDAPADRDTLAPLPSPRHGRLRRVLGNSGDPPSPRLPAELLESDGSRTLSPACLYAESLGGGGRQHRRLPEGRSQPDCLQPDCHPKGRHATHIMRRQLRSGTVYDRDLRDREGARRAEDRARTTTQHPTEMTDFVLFGAGLAHLVPARGVVKVWSRSTIRDLGK